MKDLMWHHVHVTITNREEAAIWHDQHTLAKRVQPTKRSEQLFYGPNLLQIQSDVVAPESKDAYIESIGIGVLNVRQKVANWKSAGGAIITHTDKIARVLDPWGIPFELVKTSHVGYTHINIASKNPEKLLDWYANNLGGERKKCEWESSRSAIAYDTMLIAFLKMEPPISSTSKRHIDHLGWFTNNLNNDFHRLSNNDVDFPVTPRKYGPVHLAFAKDPYGIWIELLEPPGGIIRKPG
jgi:hypothetical protein